MLVCRPGLAHERLTHANRADLLFDDVLSVPDARNDHRDFVLKLRERGVEVFELHDLLTDTLADADARGWLLDRFVTKNDVGIGLAPVFRAWLDELPVQKLAEHLIGGVALVDLPSSARTSMMADALGSTRYILSPLPGSLFPRRVELGRHRSDAESAVLAVTPPRNAPASRRVQVPSPLQGWRFHSLGGATATRRSARL